MNLKTKVKICGMTNREDIFAAIKLNVDSLGFILAKSPREIDLYQAEKLITEIPPFIDRVAVVVNPEIHELDEIISSRLFTHIQFHGSEAPEMIKNIPLKTIKAIPIADELDLKKVDKYQDYVDNFLFDTKIESKTGGTGKSFDWSLLNKRVIGLDFILAGGLGPENIEEALKKLKPAAVDLNSQLEISPGKKNHLLMKRSVEKINNYNNSLNDDLTREELK